jgi:hypothetical protein
MDRVSNTCTRHHQSVERYVTDLRLKPAANISEKSRKRPPRSTSRPIGEDSRCSGRCISPSSLICIASGGPAVVCASGVTRVAKGVRAFFNEFAFNYFWSGEIRHRVGMERWLKRRCNMQVFEIKRKPSRRLEMWGRRAEALCKCLAFHQRVTICNGTS